MFIRRFIIDEKENHDPLTTLPLIDPHKIGIINAFNDVTPRVFITQFFCDLPLSRNHARPRA